MFSRERYFTAMAWKEARRASADERIGTERRRGRGAVSNATGRFEPERRERFDDGWESLLDLEPFKTEVREEVVKTIVATNASPDLGFDRSINPYRGCEHGCIYCYARPSHAYWGYSAGLDFETKLTAKVNAAEALEKELSRPGYSQQRSCSARTPMPISLSSASGKSRAACWRCWIASATRPRS